MPTKLSFSPQNPTSDIKALQSELTSYIRRLNAALNSGNLYNETISGQFDKIIVMHREIRTALIRKKTKTGKPYSLKGNSDLLRSFNSLSLAVADEDKARRFRRSRDAQLLAGYREIAGEKTKTEERLKKINKDRAHDMKQAWENKSLNPFQKIVRMLQTHTAYDRLFRDVYSQMDAEIRKAEERHFMGLHGIRNLRYRRQARQR